MLFWRWLLHPMYHEYLCYLIWNLRIHGSIFSNWRTLVHIISRSGDIIFGQQGSVLNNPICAWNLRGWGVFWMNRGHVRSIRVQQLQILLFLPQLRNMEYSIPDAAIALCIVRWQHTSNGIYYKDVDGGWRVLIHFWVMLHCHMSREQRVI